MGRTVVVAGMTGKKAGNTKNSGHEKYWVVEDSVADDLARNCLFFSNVDPEEGQILYRLRALGAPQAVHRALGTNLGYRESNEFNGICRDLMRRSGAERVFHFLVSHNDGDVRSYSLAGGRVLTRAYGIWYRKTLNDGAAGNGHEVLNCVPPARYADAVAELSPLRGRYVDRRKDYEDFVFKA